MSSMSQGGPQSHTGSAMEEQKRTSPGEFSPALAEFLQQQEYLKKKQEWAAWADEQYVKCKNARAQFERQWYINIAFNAGRQYVAPMMVPNAGFRLTAPKAPPWRVRLVINLVRDAIRTECSKLTTSKPIPTVVPATNEAEDLGAAKIGDNLLKASFANSDFMGTYRQWIWWGAVCGVSFLKQYWDPHKPDFDAMQLPEHPRGPDGLPLPEEVVDSVPGMRQLLNTPIPATGKIVREMVSPFFVYVPDLLAPRMDDQPFVIQAMTRAPLWVENTFGFTPTCDARSTTTLLDAASIITKNAEDVLDSVLVKEIWIKPHAHKDFPAGGMLTIINSKAVQCLHEWPLSFPEYPFYKFDSVPTGGFYSDSTIVDLIPLQKEYNRTRSQMVEIKNVMGKPKILYPKGSINPRKISSEPGQSVEYQQGYDKPDVMHGVEVPQSFSNELEILKNDFDKISGQHNIADQSADLSSGTALAFLQEQDDQKLNYQVASIEYASEKMGAHYLKLVSEYWDEERSIKVVGADKAYEVVRWKEGALKGNTDVRVQTGSALPVSKAAKQATITEFMQSGFLSPEAGLEILDMGDVEKALEEYLVDKQQAMRENMKMMDMPEKMLDLLLSPAPGPNGEAPQTLQDPRTGKPIEFNGDGTPFQPQPPVPVNSWDNDEAHIQWHNHYRKSQEYENASDAHKRAFELHVQGHQLAISMDVVNMQGQMIAPGEAPPPQAIGGGAVGPDDPEFGEDPANAAGAVAREQAVDARTGTGQYGE